jgi:hypothetical protein
MEDLQRMMWLQQFEIGDVVPEPVVTVKPMLWLGIAEDSVFQKFLGRIGSGSQPQLILRVGDRGGVLVTGSMFDAVGGGQLRFDPPLVDDGSMGMAYR